LAHPDEFRGIYRELRELLGRLRSLPLLVEDAVLLRHTRQALRDHGLLDEEIDELLCESARPRRGAPPAKRAIAVAAMESKLQHPEYRLKDLVPHHCNCGKDPTGHDDYCVDRMRVAIRELKSALKKYGV